MKISNWLKESSARLKAACIESARLDCLLLLEDQLGKPREWILGHLDEKIDSSHLLLLNTKIVQRSRRIPLAYLRKRVEFYNREFYVDARVLIPRPESESIINLLLKIWVKNSGLKTILDLGTGSGILAISAKLELPNSTVVATDLSSDALMIAKKNAEFFGAKIHFYNADLLDLPESVHPEVILANLPYVPNNLVTSPEITKEPQLALFSGSDGLDHYKLFWQQLASGTLTPKYIITESLESQHAPMIELAKSAGYELQKTEVLAQLFARI